MGPISEKEAKPDDKFVETSLTDPEKRSVLGQSVDYSGAVGKSSPEEIALVRKLDIRIMVSRCLLTMLFLVVLLFPILEG